VNTREADWRLLIARPPAERERERCVVREGDADWTWRHRPRWALVAPTARLGTHNGRNGRLKAGTRTGKGTKMGCILAFLGRSQARQLMYMYARRDAMFWDKRGINEHTEES